MKYLLIILLFITTVNTSFSQENIQEIDWQKFDTTINKGKVLDPVQFGKFHIFKIININRFLYAVTIQGVKVELETPVPTELQRLFRLTPSELSATANNEEAENAIDKTTGVNETLDLLISFKQLEVSNLNTINASAKKQTKEEKLKNLLEQQLLKELKEEEKKIKAFKVDVNDYILNAKKVSNEIYFLKLLRIELVALAQMDISHSAMGTSMDTQGIKPPKRPKKLYEDLINSFDKLKKDYDDILKKIEDDDELNKKSLKNAFEKLEKAFKTVNEASLLSLYTDVNFLYNELRNEKNFTVYAPPVQGDGDFVNYNVTITPARTNNLGIYNSTKNFKFDVPVKGGLKVDFSVGPIFSFGDNAKDEKYFLEKSDTENQSILRKRDNNNAMTPGLGAMMHFYKRSGTNFSWGGMFGVGAGFQTVEDLNLSFYTGISFVFGKSQKIMLSTGISMLGVDRLKNNEFEVGNEYVTADIDINNITEKVFKSSFFLSISYNLANRTER